MPLKLLRVVGGKRMKTTGSIGSLHLPQTESSGQIEQQKLDDDGSESVHANKTDSCIISSRGGKSMDMGEVRRLFFKQTQRANILLCRQTKLDSLYQRMHKKHLNLENDSSTAETELETVQDSLQRLQGLEKKLERRYENLIENRQSEMEAEAARCSARSKRLQALVEEFQAEQNRVYEKRESLRAQRDNLATQVRSELAAVDKITSEKKVKEQARETQMAIYKEQWEELDKAFEGMNAEMKDLDCKLQADEKRIALSREHLAQSNSKISHMMREGNEMESEFDKRSGSDVNMETSREGSKETNKNVLTEGDLARLQKKVKVRKVFEDRWHVGVDGTRINSLTHEMKDLKKKMQSTHTLW